MSPPKEDRPQDERRMVQYRGRVQGVGFRATACDIARNYGVTGYVQNMPDGQVRLVAEGEPQELTSFLSAVQNRLGRYIAAAAVESSPATGEFEDFGVRYY